MVKGGKVKEFFSYFKEEFGIKIIYSKGKRDIRFYKPKTYPPKQRGKFIYHLEDVDLLGIFKDKKGEFKLPSDYKEIKRRIYDKLPQFFRTLYQFNFYAKPTEKDTPEPFAEFIVFAYNKQPRSYSEDNFSLIELHLREMAMIDRVEQSALELDITQHKANWTASIDFEACNSGFEQDTPLSKTDMKHEGTVLTSDTGTEIKLYGIGGAKAVNYVHRLTVYLAKTGTVKGAYCENYWQNAELSYLAELGQKLEHLKGHLIHKHEPRLYMPKYPVRRGLKWK